MNRKERRRELVKNGFCSNNCGRKLSVKWFCRKCADKVNQYALNSYYKNRKKNAAKKLEHLHKYRFGGFRGEALKRDNYICQTCGYDFQKIGHRPTWIHVHHINENSSDNRLENLITLCRYCHIVIEKINKIRPDIKKIFYWFR